MRPHIYVTDPQIRWSWRHVAAAALYGMLAGVMVGYGWLLVHRGGW